MKSKKISTIFSVIALAMITFSNTFTSGVATAQSALDPPTITCVPSSSTGTSITIQVCAGPSGAPAGFSVQWIKKSEFLALGGWPVSSDVPNPNAPSFCKASFSGVPGGSTFNLPPNGCVDVTVGDVLFDTVGASRSYLINSIFGV